MKSSADINRHSSFTVMIGKIAAVLQFADTGGRSRVLSTHNRQGFTLIELCVATAIAMIVLAAVYAAYRSQLGTYVTQETIVDMQQNARAGMFLIEREIRLAGYDATGSAGAGIINAASDSITFTMDLSDDGDVADDGEQIRYTLSGGDLVRENINAGSGLQPAALNIDALNFVYLDDDGDTTSDIPAIRSIQITLVARSGDDAPALAPDYTDTRVYRNQVGEIILAAQNDGLRRMLLTSDVKCRNLGLE